MAELLVLLDTRTVVWWIQEPGLLGAEAREAIDSAGRIVLPAIAFWEVAILVRKGRLCLNGNQHPSQWAARVLAIPRVTSAPLTPQIAIRADGLEMHPDPADRFIVAAALEEEAPIVTKDGLLRELPFVRTIW